MGKKQNYLSYPKQTFLRGLIFVSDGFFEFLFKYILSCFQGLNNYYQKSKIYHQKFTRLSLWDLFLILSRIWPTFTKIVQICPKLKLLHLRKNDVETSYRYHHLHFSETILQQSQLFPALKIPRPEWRPLSSQPVITCSKLTIKTLEQGVKYI